MKTRLLQAALAVVSALALIKPAYATLSVVDNGLGVYSSISNVTWTQDANLLGTMESQQGFDTVVNAIIAASPNINDLPNGYDTPHNSGHHILTINDFVVGGIVSWWGAQGFVHYLNTINYGGSSQWALPTTVDNNSSSGYNITNSVLGQLYYSELSKNAYNSSNNDWGIFGNGVSGTSGSVGPFSNAQASTYWLGSDYALEPINAWGFWTFYGFQGDTNKNYHLSAWAVSPGQLVASVPESDSFAMLLAGLGVMGLVLHRRHDG